MNIGMLWFDNDPKVTTAEKIKSAAAYYKNKYARYPNVVFTHPDTFATLQSAIVETATGLAIQVKPNRSVPVNHYWIGVQSE